MNFSCVTVFIAILLCSFSCDTFPKDPDNTLKHVTNGKLYVGITHNPPWTETKDSVYTGIEAEIVMNFARELHAQIVWVHGSETVLMSKMDHNELHLVIGGFELSSPWNRDAGFTNAYYKRRSIAAPDGENAFIIRLEKYLHENKEPIKEMIKSFEEHKLKEKNK
jgi:polar amino acid transport system substrate-binding protein